MSATSASLAPGYLRNFDHQFELAVVSTPDATAKGAILARNTRRLSAKAPWELLVTELISQRGAALTRYAQALCGNSDDAADLVQDALVRTFSRLRGGLEIDSAESYVRKAILNAHLDGNRRRSIWRRIAPIAIDPLPAIRVDSQIDERTDLVRKLQTLSPRERSCIVLRYLEDQTVDSVAEYLGLSSGAVKRYLSDALKKLQISFLESEPDRGVNHGN
ncbi:MAG: sigma-70 family RNA polymerase sigma factor [Cryobacterium sp.]|nr:sigma-70 family RNA polymerase sigma factor [Cryobacterium sp.]